MKTPTNWEDNQLFRDAAQSAARDRKRESAITEAIHRHLDSLRKELAEDFGLADGAAVDRIKRAL